MAASLAARKDLLDRLLRTVNLLEERTRITAYQSLNISQPTTTIELLMQKFKDEGFYFTETERRIFNNSFNVIYRQHPDIRPDI
jgi:hypothetical protein